MSTYSENMMKEKIVYSSEMHQRNLIDNLAAIRRFKRLTQLEVGSVSGCAKSNISRLESHTHSPSFNTLCNYIAGLGLKFKIVLFKDEEGNV